MATSSQEQFENFNYLHEGERKILNEYWLRFLEVEIVETEPKVQGSKNYKSLEKMGRSIFTVTKRLRKEPDEKDFGFESNLLWTKPCIVKEIRKDSPADKSHLLSGDLIIFIENQNIVDMEKKDVINLLKNRDALVLEIFRRTNVKDEIQKIVQATSTKTQVSVETSVSIESVPSKSKLTSKSSTESRKKQLTFSKDESTTDSIDSQKSLKLVSGLLQSESRFLDDLKFGSARFIFPLQHRKDLISSKEHEVLFSSIERIRKVMELICKSDQRDSPEAVIQSYKKNIEVFLLEFEKYLQSLKAADHIIMDKTHHPEFIKFISTNPSVPVNQPMIHNFIHKPLDFFNSLMKNMKIFEAQYSVNHPTYNEIEELINMLQASFCDGMSKRADDKIEIKPLLRSLESRLVFTKCNPFKLDVPGRQWIFAGDLIKIEPNLMEKPTYTLLFNDIIIFATINRDRVLFIMEEPINIKSVVESHFNIRKKEKEFRLTIETNPNYKEDHSPTTNCTPDIRLRRSPMRQSKRRNIIFRAPSEEIKKVWQNLITQQVFNINNQESPLAINFDQFAKASPLTESFIRNNVSTKKNETEEESAPIKCAPDNNNSIQLQPQLAFDLGSDDLNNSNSNSPKTPATPAVSQLSLNLSSLNIKIHNSLSHSSSINCSESCDGIFNDFDNDMLFSKDILDETMFLQNDPFFADET